MNENKKNGLVGLIGVILVFVSIAYMNYYILAIGAFFLLGFIQNSITFEIKTFIDNKFKRKEQDYFSNFDDKKIELVSVNTAFSNAFLSISKEISFIKSRLDTNSFPDIPKDFLNIYYFYQNYPYIAHALWYSTGADKNFGLCVVLLSVFSPFMLEPNELDEKTLRLLFSTQITEIRKDMCLEIYIYDGNLPNNFNFYQTKNAKVISINQDEFGYNVCIEVQIEEDNIITRRLSFSHYPIGIKFILD